MKTINHIVLSLICIVCISCKVDFDFSDLESEPILCLDMNLAYDPVYYEGGVIPDDVPLYLSGFIYAIPSAAGEREFPEHLQCTMEVYHDSELVWSRDDIRLHKFEGLVLAEIYDLAPGDELKVVAMAEGFPTATSTVSVPQTPPQITVSHSSINSNLFRICFTIEDNPDSEDCYAFSFQRVSYYGGYPKPHSSGTAMDLAFGSDNENSFLGIGPFEAVWEDGERLYGISDRSFNGRKKTFEVNAEYDLPYGEDAEDYAYYRIRIHQYTPARLKYEIACNDKANNILGFIGLAPVTFAYTNISGGTGCISCSNINATEWINMPPVGEIEE